MPFRDITGQRRLLDLLARSICRGTLPPSLIFAGPAGGGKRATAVALAQALNCLEPLTSKPDSVDACGRCSACRRIAREIHPDVLLVEPGDSGSIKIDQVRDVIDRAGYRPFEGVRRVVIICTARSKQSGIRDEADALFFPAAQNALLKTLEEPPPSSMFVLVTARPDALLPTVRSRCIRLWFAVQDVDDIDAEARDVAERVLTHAAVTTDDSRRLDGAKELLTHTGASSAGDREQLASHLRAMASMLRDVEVLAACADARALTSPRLKPVLERLVPAYQGQRGVRAFAAIDRALVALDRNAGVKVVADWVMLQL
jgi:DNA polymerase III subunit delta'